jgi:hypothetical protein
MMETGTILLALTRRQTWGVYGDSPSDFLQRQLFNIGCVAPFSITPALGGGYWLSENGTYFFDGSSPTYNADKINNYLRAIPGSPGAPGSAGIPVSAQLQACGSFFNLTYYLHFPTLQQTVGFHTVANEWLGTLPYAPAAPGAVCTVLASPNSSAAQQWNEVVAARVNSTAVDWYFADANFDLGLAQTCSWDGGATFAPTDSSEKQYRYMTLTGPLQPGSAIATLTVDPGSNPPKQVVWVIPDLSTGQARKVRGCGVEVDGQSALLRGFMAQLSVQLLGVTGQPAPQLWSVSVWGQTPPDRNLVLPA